LVFISNAAPTAHDCTGKTTTSPRRTSDERLLPRVNSHSSEAPIHSATITPAAHQHPGKIASSAFLFASVDQTPLAIRAKLGRQANRQFRIWGCAVFPTILNSRADLLRVHTVINKTHSMSEFRFAHLNLLVAPLSNKDSECEVVCRPTSIVLLTDAPRCCVT
jgi:hypothetical protein